MSQKQLSHSHFVAYYVVFGEIRTGDIFTPVVGIRVNQCPLSLTGITPLPVTHRVVMILARYVTFDLQTLSSRICACMTYKEEYCGL